MPPRASPPLQSGGQNQKWPTYGQGNSVTPTASRIPSALERGAKSEVAHLWARWLHNSLPPRGFPLLQSAGAESEVAHLWARWLRNPCRLRDPPRFRAGDKMRSGPVVGKVAT